MCGSSLLAVAALADVLIGDPPGWPHLIRVIGQTIGRLELWIRWQTACPPVLLAGGGFLILVVVGGSWLAAWAAMGLASWIWAPLGWLLGLVITFQCLAAGQLYREAVKVVIPLRRGDLPAARAALAMIVGRETKELDEAGIRRAVLETVAENLGDGVVAPLFFLLLGGPPLALAYKAVNTLDSMVGYKQEPYTLLGRLPARLDDVAGWIPARLTGLLLVAAAPLVGLSAREAFTAMSRDHGAHKSPNAGWPEAATAGALGVSFGGPNLYFGVMVEKDWINPGAPAPADPHLNAGLDLYVVASTLAMAASFLILWFWQGWW
ncbi:MAG: adenosylcobinamide-phosphate synthase CbiB [Deltaproteobacteria bacterium]|nr:adenosylcobinamide-phosphate synthase CbiB [Deltaproteobacteria bacterium]